MGKRIVGDDVARFWSYVDKRGADECWPWIGAATNGRGYIGIGRKTLRATRYMWQLAHGEALDASKKICHACDNPICVNPAHLWVGSQFDNVQDMDRKRRRVNANEKLSPELVSAIRVVCASCPDVNVRTFSVVLGINYMTLYDILRRKTWKDVP
jgi:hypothetical protein